MKVKVGFVGVGKIAWRHIEKLKKIEDAILVSFCDKEEEKARQAAKTCSARAYSNFCEMLDKEKLDAIYVCLPPFAHTNQEILAAQRGINLFIEKPIALSLERANKINQAIQKNGIICAVGYLYRYADIVNKAKDLLREERIALFSGYYFCPPPDLPWWKDKKLSGGQIVEQATHIFDLARYLVGEVESVQGRGIKELSNPHFTGEDASSFLLQFKNGAIGSISCSCLLSQEKEWGATLISPGLRLDLALSSHFLRISNHKKANIKMEIDPYQEENRIFIQAVKNRSAGLIKTPYPEALETLKLTLAAREALEKGKIINLS